MLRVQARIFRASPENQDKNVLAKLLVSSNQIGCLLGKGGSIIAEMRKSTGAYIRILGKDQLPKGASENEEVVQVCFYFVYALNEFDYHDSFGIWICLVNMYFLHDLCNLSLCFISCNQSPILTCC